MRLSTTPFQREMSRRWFRVAAGKIAGHHEVLCFPRWKMKLNN